MSAVVSDTSPLHYLIECQAIELLPRLFGSILIPPKVHDELQHARTPQKVRSWAQSLPTWIQVRAPDSVDTSLDLDEGERQAICLAKEINAAAILMDDKKGRLEAVRHGFRVAGTIGILTAAAEQRMIDLDVAFQRLRATNARIDEALMEAALKLYRKRRT